jgi:predicted CXXCH cytochrome family protein
MRKNILLLTAIFVVGYIIPAISQANFSTSLHATRNGKPYFYNTEANGGSGGFETFTGVPINTLGCVECHDAVDANGSAYPVNYVPGCVDCHATNTPGMPVTQADCLGCHSRENAIINNPSLTDVHRAKGFTCMSCHKKEELHGDDGIAHKSLFDTGAIQADCANTECHPNYTHSNPGVDPHAGKLHCTSCHAQSNLACYSCHFESQVQTHLKRPQRQITGFVMLVNRTKDNKVHPATFQSITYEGKAGVVIGPSVAHTIVKTGARTCTNCHQNMGGNIPAITDYNADGIIKFATWNVDTLNWHKGIVPIPFDYNVSFKMDYITYNGSTSDPVAYSKNWSVVKDNADLFQILYCTPLTTVQMAKIGMDTTKSQIPVELISFSANVIGEEVILNWSTATELNNSGFEIQRKTNQEFLKIGFAKGNGTTTESQNYSFVDKQLKPGFYSYRLKQIDLNGKYAFSKVINVQVVQGLNYSLEQNYPNPFNPETSIKYSIPQNGKVSIKVYNLTGKEIMTLIDKEMTAGSYEVKWNGTDNAGITVPSGVYFMRLSSGTYVESKKMVFLK